MIASGLGQASMVELLLTAGAQVLAVEPRAGATALHKAALSGNPDVADLLLAHGAFIDQQTPVLGHTALMDAVVYKHAAMVRFLLKRGARTTIRNHWQETALQIARRDDLTEIASMIAARDAADIEALSDQRLIAAVKSADLQEVERLIAAGTPVDDRVPMTGSPDDDYTALAIAARDGHAEIARVLLEAGAEPRRVIGLFSGTPVHEACYFGHADVIDVMFEARSRAVTRPPELDVQGALNGFTPLHDAVWHGHLEAARAIVRAGHPLELRNQAGLTSREMALLYGYHELASFLADAEAV
jgi:ankyrin repeat protein